MDDSSNPAHPFVAESRTELPTALSSSLKRVVVASSLGSLIEYYDFMLYAGMASILAMKFFPTHSPGLSLLISVAVFGTGFVARPFGALVFGRMSDLIGRKVTFLITLTLMGSSTTLIGALPTYATWGIVAPLILIALRLLQGISLGGEYGGAITYVAEFTTDKRRGFLTSFIQATPSVGLVIALLTVFVVRDLLGQQAFEAWGWRIPFLISAALVIFSIIIRMTVRESPLFEKLKSSGRRSRSPIKDTVLQAGSWQRVTVALFAVASPYIAAFYTSNIYALVFLQGNLKVETARATLAMAVAMLFTLPLFPLLGAWSDRIGRAKMIRWGCVLAIVGFIPIYHGIVAAVAASNWVALTALLFLQMVPSTIIGAPTAALLVEMFPARTRTTSVGLSNQIGNVLFAGFLPLIGLSLSTLSGNRYAGLLFPMAVLFLCAVVNAVFAARFDLERLSGGGSLVDNDPDIDAVPGELDPMTTNLTLT